MEKEFSFTKCRAPNECEEVIRKESELEDWEINHLAGEYIHNFNQLPEKAKQIVCQYLKL